MIDGVRVKNLKIISDERGFLMECLRKDDQDFFREFGQVYISAVYKDAVKAWHYHKKQTDLVVCVSGLIKLVLHDGRKNSPTYGIINEFFIGDRNPCLIKIPVRVDHGWKGIESPISLVMNCPDHVYDYDDPDEFRKDPYDNDINYKWERKDG